MQPSGKYAAEVANGAAWLDTILCGWEPKIDVGDLRMNLSGYCICGQLLCSQILLDAFPYASTGYGVFREMAYAAGYENTEDLARYYGFVPIFVTSQGGPCQEMYRLNQVEWDDLGAHWIALIKDRLDQGVTLGV